MGLWTYIIILSCVKPVLPLPARSLDAGQHFFAVLQLVHEFRDKLGLLPVQTLRPVERELHDLTERPFCHGVGLVDMCHKEPVRGQDDLRMVVEVELR